MGTLFGTVLLAAHLATMNLAAAGPLVAAWLASGRGERELLLGQRVAKGSLTALIVSSVLAGGLLAAPREGLRAALGRFPASTYWFAGAELVFSAACLGGLLLVVRRAHVRRGWAWLLALATATNLLYHFPPLMAVIGKLAGDPHWAPDAVINHKTLLGLAARPDVLALWIHFVLASVAGAAIFALWPRRLDEGNATQGTAGDLTTRRLAGAALVASFLQLPVGVWVLAASRTSVRDALLGDDIAASACFAVGVVLAIGLMHSLAAITLGDATESLRRRTAWLFLAIAVAMSAALMGSRRGDGGAAHTAAALQHPGKSQVC